MRIAAIITILCSATLPPLAQARSGFSNQPPVQKVPYTVVERRAAVRILLVSPAYRNEAALRRLGDQLKQDFSSLPIVIAVVFDNAKAAALYDRMLSSSGSIDAKTDAFYDFHMVANYSRTVSTGYHSYTIWPTGARGTQIDVKY